MPKEAYRRRRLLLVDRKYGKIPTLKDSLAEAGFMVYVADSVGAACLALQDLTIDVMVLEIQTPKGYQYCADEVDGTSERWQTSWPGLDLLRMVRNGELQGIGQNLPVIVITSIVMEHQVKEIENHHPTRLLEKPCNIPIMVETCKSVLLPPTS